MKSTVVQYNSWHTGTGIKWTGKEGYWLEEGEEVEDGRAEGSPAIGDGRQAAISLMPDVNGTGCGSLLEQDAFSHLWKFTTWWFICRGFTVHRNLLHSYTLTMKDQKNKLRKQSHLLMHQKE